VAQFPGQVGLAGGPLPGRAHRRRDSPRPPFSRFLPAPAAGGRPARAEHPGLLLGGALRLCQPGVLRGPGDTALARPGEPGMRGEVERETGFEPATTCLEVTA